MNSGIMKYIMYLLRLSILVSGIYLFLTCKDVLQITWSGLIYELQSWSEQKLLPNLKAPVQHKTFDITEYVWYQMFPAFGYSTTTKTKEVESMSTYEKIIEQEAMDEENTELPIENNPAENMETEQKPERYTREMLSERQFLMEEFYTVDRSAKVDEQLFRIEHLLDVDLSIEKDTDGPQILIYHTHSQEGFVDSVPGDLNTTIVGVGDRLSEILEEEYGYRVLHVRDVFDMKDGKEDRNQAYALAGTKVQQVLNENPSIQVVIDLHRDGVKEGVRLMKEIEGRPTAQFMFFNGLSNSKKNGPITYLPNENLQYNLAMSFQMQYYAANKYPGIARKIYLKTYRYNLHLTKRAMLIECGAQTNTLEEEKNAMIILAELLNEVIG